MLNCKDGKHILSCSFSQGFTICIALKQNASGSITSYRSARLVHIAILTNILGDLNVQGITDHWKRWNNYKFRHLTCTHSPLVFLSNVVFFWQINQVDHRFWSKKQMFVQNINLEVRTEGKNCKNSLNQLEWILGSFSSWHVWEGYIIQM